MRPLRICLLASELAPYAKTGGLADVLAGLGRYLDRQGHDVRLFVPLYQSIAKSDLVTTLLARAADLDIRIGQRTIRASIRTATLPQSKAQVHFVDCPELFHRQGLYTQDADEGLRFAFFTRAVLDACQRLAFAPDVFHCNDWHTALLPLYLKTTYGWDRMFAASRTILTIHNIGYQGMFGADVIDSLGLGDQRGLLHHGDLKDHKFNFLKTGVLHASKLTTVSRTYAKEIQTSEHGMGLDELLRTRSSDLTGIVNGVDYGDWDPQNDPLIPHRYVKTDLRGKAKMKEALLSRLGLQSGAKSLVFGVVSRLTSQKGFDLFADSIPIFLQREDMRLCVLGSGDAHHEKYFQWLRDTWPKKVGIFRGYNDELAHWIEAGSDVFLMPSRYEPCGLNQMYSLRYGTPPVVRRTGGLADTVQQWNPSTGEGTGFCFEEFSSHALAGTLEWVFKNWRDQESWQKLMQNGMAMDFSWDKQGPDYVRLYRSLVSS
ncbi:glycogen synthase 1 [Planctomycetota bacterium]|nr:glycogen synthase [Planctomycetota bacterium]MSR38047.1 glycogen synthase [Planctomycetota bacterium]GDY02068.1 glycogen synthase 1 [Planctomycetota bacterium]